VIPFGVGSLTMIAYLRSFRSIVRLNFYGVAPRWALFADILKVGVPGLINTAITNLSVVVLTGIAGQFGREAAIGYLRVVGPVYVCFGLGLGLFFACQGSGRGFAAMIANAVRLFVSAGAGLAAVYWLDLGTAGLFTAIAAGFCIYAALTTLAVVRISPPATPTVR
jgi:Na+-driven multidrug efflux pump